MIVVDVPGDLADDLLVLLGRGQQRRTRVEAVHRIGNTGYGVDQALRQARDLIGGRRKRIALGVPFTRDHEEQLVLDDRARQRGAVGFALEIEIGVDVAADLLTGQAVGILAVEGVAVEIVGAGRQDRVDRTAQEVALAHVIRRDRGAELADRVERHRTAAGGVGVRVEAEVVRNDDAVDREAIVARVDTGEGDRAAAAGGFLEARERIAAGEIADIAVDRCDAADLALREDRLRAVRRHARARQCRRGDDDVAAFFTLGCGEFDRQVIRLADDGIDVGDRLAAFSAGHFDGVGAARAKIRDVERTVGVRRRSGTAVRAGIDNRHAGAGDRRPVVRHCTTNSRGGFLCHRTNRRDERDGSRAQKQVMSHLLSP